MPFLRTLSIFLLSASLLPVFVASKSLPPNSPITSAGAAASSRLLNARPVVFGSSDRDFTDFQQRSGRTYKTVAERQSRLAIFKRNVEYVNKHNADYLAGKTT